MTKPKNDPLMNLADFLVEDIMSMSDEEILAEMTPEDHKAVEDMRVKIDEIAMNAMIGGMRRPRQTTLVYRDGGFVSREVGDDGKIIEPCRKCGPMLLCSDCMSRMT